MEGCFVGGCLFNTSYLNGIITHPFISSMFFPPFPPHHPHPVPCALPLNHLHVSAKCRPVIFGKLPVPHYFVVIMGEVIDFFKPLEGATFCEMLHSHDKHQWSSDGLTWTTPTYSKWEGDHGSSADYWPRDNVEGDERFRLSS